MAKYTIEFDHAKNTNMFSMWKDGLTMASPDEMQAYAFKHKDTGSMHHVMSYSHKGEDSSVTTTHMMQCEDPECMKAYAKEFQTKAALNIEKIDVRFRGQMVLAKVFAPKKS